MILRYEISDGVVMQLTTSKIFIIKSISIHQFKMSFIFKKNMKLMKLKLMRDKAYLCDRYKSKNTLRKLTVYQTIQFI